MLAEAADAGPVPTAFVPVTVNVYSVFDCKPTTDIGEDAPEAVNDPGEDVTVKDVAAGEFSGKENVTSARPLLYARLAGTFVAVTDVGAIGSKKSFDACAFLPNFLPTAILNLLFYYLNLCYAIKSP
jgi:hypothetical protein